MKRLNVAYTLSWLLGLAVVMSSGCQYRFTNLTQRGPPGIRSIAIEAVYNTAGLPLPHEVIWNELQAAFATNGRLVLTDRRQADALLRVWVRKAALGPSGSHYPRAVSGFLPEGARDNKLAEKYTLQETLSFAMEAEIWDLRQDKAIFRRSYNRSRVFASIRSEDVAVRESHFLLMQESLRSSLRIMMEELSRRLVADFLVDG